MTDSIEYFNESHMHLLLSSLKHSVSIKIFTSGVVCGLILEKKLRSQHRHTA